MVIWLKRIFEIASLIQNDSNFIHFLIMTTKKETVVPVVYPPKVNFLKNFVYGGFAGFVGSLFTFPIDLCKTLVQMDKEVKKNSFALCHSQDMNNKFAHFLAKAVQRNL